MRTKRLFLGGISAVSITAMVGWNASASAGEVIIDFSHTPGPDGLLGTKDDVPIENILGTGGELTGDEFVSVGIHFSTTGLQLNIGCGQGPGDPVNCLGADASIDDDFAGLLIGQFTLGGGPATVATLFLDVVNDDADSFTTLFDSEGRVITTFLNDVSYDGPTPVARFETQLNFDAHFTVQYAGLGQCPWDLDGSGIVGATDLLSLLVNWGKCPGCPADFDGNGVVGATDLLALLVNWGPCP
ncbi:MAG: hypothetical protein V3T84_10630 [Phycisphaerales bacterium]